MALGKQREREKKTFKEQPNMPKKRGEGRRRGEEDGKGVPNVTF